MSPLDDVNGVRRKSVCTHRVLGELLRVRRGKAQRWRAALSHSARSPLAIRKAIGQTWALIADPLLRLGSVLEKSDRGASPNPKALPSVAKGHQRSLDPSRSVSALSGEPGFADLNLRKFRRIDSRGVAFEQRKVCVFPRLEAANDVIHAALPGSIDCHGPERHLDCNALVSKKHVASFVHGADDGILDTAQWLKRRNVPVRVSEMRTPPFNADAQGS